MAEVVQHTGQESASRDSSCHHDDVIVGCDFLGGCSGSFGVDDIVHEVFTIGLKFEATGRIRTLTSPVPRRVEGGEKETYASVCSVAYSACR